MGKLLGALLLFLSASGMGFLLAGELSDRVQRLRQIQKLLVILSNDLKYQKTQTLYLLRQISEDASFQQLTFLQSFTHWTLPPCSLSELFGKAVSQQQNLQPEERQLLLELGELLGGADSASQLKGLALLQEKLALLLEEAVQRQQIQGKLFRSAGVLVGLLLLLLSL